MDETEMMKLLGEILEQESKIRLIENEKKVKNLTWDMDILTAENAIKSLYQRIEKQMNGAREVILPGETVDYKISYTTPRKSIDVADIEAVPAEFVSIREEKSPKKKEIAAYLETCRAEHRPLPNWAIEKVGESKLQWAGVKKKARTEEAA